MNNNLQIESVSFAHPHSGQELYYKLVCIDQQHASLACQVLTTPDQHSGQHSKLAVLSLKDKSNNVDNRIKAVCLGRAVIVSINIEDIEQSELAEINYLLASVRVHAMAYDDNEGLSQYDKDELEKI